MPNFGVHMATGVGQLVGLPRDVYSLVSPMDPNRRVAGAWQRQPGRLVQSGGNGEGGTASHLCRPTSGQQSPKVLVASSPLARRGKTWGPDADDKEGGVGDAFVRRPKQGAAGVLANHHPDTQRGVQDACDTTWAVLGMRMETEDAEDGADAQGSSQHQGLHQLLAASTRRVPPKKSSTAAPRPGRAMGGPGSVSSGQLPSAHRRVFGSETLLASVSGRSGITSAMAFHGRETGTSLNARDSLVRSNSAEDLLAAAVAGPRGFVGGGVSKGARGRGLFSSDRVP